MADNQKVTPPEGYDVVEAPEGYDLVSDEELPDFSKVKGGASTNYGSSFYTKPLFSYNTGGARGGGYREDASGNKVPEQINFVSPRDIVHELPNVLAGAASLAQPEIGLFRALATAGLTGAGGSGLAQATDVAMGLPPDPNGASTATKAGFEQMLYEVPGQALKGIKGLIKSRLPQKPEELVAEKVAKDLGLDVTPGEIAPKLGRKETQLKTIKDAAETEINSIFGKPDTAHNIGVAVYDANKAAREVAGKISSENYAKLEGLTVDLSKNTRLLRSLPPSLLPRKISKALATIAELRNPKYNNPPELIAKETKKLLGEVDFNTVRELRSGVREAAYLPPTQALMAKQNVGELKLAHNKLSDILTKSARAQGKGAEYETARNFHREIGDLFQRGLGSEINKLERDPQKIINLVTLGDMSAVKDLKAIFNYAQKYGSPVQALTAAKAEKAFQRGVLEERVLNFPVEKWADAIDDKIGKNVLAEIIGDVPANNLKAIATTAKQLNLDSRVAEDALALLVAKTGKLPAGMLSTRSVLKDITSYVTPSVQSTRRYVSALEAIGSKNPGNMIRGAKIMVDIWNEMEKNKPPAPPRPQTTPPPLLAPPTPQNP